MSDNKGRMDKRKQSLLVELESIKHLLDNTSDTIPVLEQAVFTDDNGHYIDVSDENTQAEDSSYNTENTANSSDHRTKESHQQYSMASQPNRTHIPKREILPASVFNPNNKIDKNTHNKINLADQSPLSEGTQQGPSQDTITKPILDTASSVSMQSHALTTPAIKQKSTNTSSTRTLNNNPFLPKHVREKLDQQAIAAAAAIEQEIASQQEQRNDAQNAYDTEYLVNQLVAQYLPRIEAELREKLLDTVKRHEDNDKKSF